MKKQIITVITVIACVALCVAVWPRSAGVEELPAEPIINAVSAKIEARLEEPRIFLSLPIFLLLKQSQSRKANRKQQG